MTVQPNLKTLLNICSTFAFIFPIEKFSNINTCVSVNPETLIKQTLWIK